MVDAVALEATGRKVVQVRVLSPVPALQQMRAIADQYFTEHPEAKDGVMRAWHAYHVYHPYQHPEAHNFDGPYRDCKCSWCGRSRENVRHDDLPATCSRRPLHKEIKDVIKLEEQKANIVLNNAEIYIPKILKTRELNGDTLFFFHGTHGWPIDVVELIIDIPLKARNEYEQLLQAEAQKDADLTKSRQKVITVSYDK